jgi:signal transduction histidine kinase
LRYKELNSTKDKFFSIIAHDLKSPFSTIMGFSSILSEQARKKEYDGVEQYASIIEDASVRAMELLRNLLEWSRSQTGRMTFSPEPLDLGLLIRDTTEQFRDAAMHKQITISVEAPSGLFWKADRPMIDSVLRNFISNAIKFTHSSGSIVVIASPKEQEVVVEVRDTGIGIAKMNLSKLFRLDESFSTNGTLNEKGTGLGLLLSKEFIEKHGGQIWVESEHEKGSSFFFSIPKA